MVVKRPKKLIEMLNFVFSQIQSNFINSVCGLGHHIINCPVQVSSVLALFFYKWESVAF